MTLPSMQGDAPLIRAAITRLETYMPGQVTVFNAEDVNTVELTAPATYHFGGQDLLAAFAFPQVEVAVVAGNTGNFAVDRTEVDNDPSLNVAIWVDGADGGGDVPTLYETVLGLKRCVIECLVASNVFGPGVQIAQENGISWRADVVPFDATAYTPAEGRKFQKWLGSALIQFKLEDVEHFT
jgi:hypothetical protein